MSNVDDSHRYAWEKKQADAASKLDETLTSTPSTGGGGGSTYDGMERIAKLEARADGADKRLDRMDGKLDTLIERTAKMPTTNGLWGMIATVIGVALTMIAIVVAVVTLMATLQ